MDRKVEVEVDSDSDTDTDAEVEVEGIIIFSPSRCQSGN